jgi:organic radical activating enzyme
MTKQCNRDCEGCCNQYWDLDKLPVFEIGSPVYKTPDMFIITGGEPMLFPDELIKLIRSIKTIYLNTIVTVYTANVTQMKNVHDVLSVADGMTVTLHEDTDVEPFQRFQMYLRSHNLRNKTFYLNIFKHLRNGVDIMPILWDRIKLVEWIPDCPLPEKEVFMRTKKLMVSH